MFIALVNRRSTLRPVGATRHACGACILKWRYVAINILLLTELRKVTAALSD
jgi:hypothetical protein